MTTGQNEEKNKAFYADLEKKSLRETFKHKFNGAWIANCGFT